VLTISYYLLKPGKCKKSKPIICKISTEKIISKSPVIAEVILSRPSFTFSGFPREATSWYPAAMIRIIAIPPERLKRIAKTFPTSPAGSVEMRPIAVSTPLQPPLLSVDAHWAKAGTRILKNEKRKRKKETIFNLDIQTSWHRRGFLVKPFDRLREKFLPERAYRVEG